MECGVATDGLVPGMNGSRYREYAEQISSSVMGVRTISFKVRTGMPAAVLSPNLSASWHLGCTRGWGSGSHFLYTRDCVVNEHPGRRRATSPDSSI